MKHWLKLPSLIRWLITIGCIYLLLFSLMRLGLFLFFSSRDFSLAQLGDAFFLGLRYDLRMICLVLLVILVLGSFPQLHPFSSRRNRAIWLGVLAVTSFVAVFFFVVDFAHYAYLVQRLNASVLNYLEDAGISLNMVWQSYPVGWMLLAIAALTTGIVWVISRSWRRIHTNTYMPARRMRIVSFTIFFLLAGFFIFGRLGQYPLRWSDAFALGSDYKANLSLNPFESFFTTLKFRRSSYDLEKVKKYYPVLSQYFDFEQQPGNELNFTRVVTPDSGAITSQPNIVLVICESFSGYKSSMWGNPLNTTPFFDSLCRNGIFFDNCFTPTYGTARGIWATITGTPDVERPKTASRNPSAVSQHTIINNFTGYEKLYFIGGSTSWANIRGLLTNNIDGLKLYEQDDFEAPKIDVWGISDKNLFLEANKIMARQDKPFFAVIQTADNHRPYTIPEEDLDEFVTVDIPLDSLRNNGFESLAEMNAFRYTDFGYRKFMEAAIKERYFDNTIFIFIGDHGIPGNAGREFPEAWTEQRLAAEHVPLLIYAPSLLEPRRLNMVCSQVDVLPTIAGLSNITYTNTTLGRDLLDSTLKPFAFIYDPDFNMAGVIKDGYFYRKQLNTQKEELVPVTLYEASATDSVRQAVHKELPLLTNALYETAKYLLLNNKK